MFSVRRFGVTGALARTLTNTNCIESMISIARRPSASSSRPLRSGGAPRRI